MVDRYEVYFAMRREDFHPHSSPPPSPLKLDLRQGGGDFGVSEWTQASPML